MKEFAIICCLLMSVQNNIFAQKKKTSAGFYPVVVKFESVCCGVPGDAPLRSFIRQFKTDYKIKSVTAFKYAPMGREGEYHLAFPLREMNREQRFYFKTKLNAVIPELKDKGKAEMVINMTIKKESLPSNATITKVSY